MLKNNIVGRLQALISGAPAEPAIVLEDGPELRQLRKEVVRGLVEVMHPILHAERFGRFVNGTAWRHSESWVDVVQIQFIRTEHTSPHSPSLHLGRYFNFVPQRDAHNPVKFSLDKYFPQPEQCHIRKTVYKPARDRKNPSSIWGIGPNGEGLEQCLAQAQAVTQSDIVPWCQWLDDPVEALELVLRGVSDAEGRSTDSLLCGTWNHETHFGQHVLAGMLAFRLKRWQVAAQQLMPVIAYGGTLGRNQRMVPLPAPTMADLKEALALAKSHL